MGDKEKESDQPPVSVTQVQPGIVQPQQQKQQNQPPPPPGFPPQQAYYGQPAYGQPAYGQPMYGQPAYGQPAYGQPMPPMQGGFGQPVSYSTGQQMAAIQAQPQPQMPWMERPSQPIANCPPGLEYLSAVDQLVINQMIEMMEVMTGMHMPNKYRIHNTMGQQCYFAQENNFAL